MVLIEVARPRVDPTQSVIYPMSDVSRAGTPGPDVTVHGQWVALQKVGHLLSNLHRRFLLETELHALPTDIPASKPNKPLEQTETFLSRELPGLTYLQLVDMAMLDKQELRTVGALGRADVITLDAEPQRDTITRADLEKVEWICAISEIATHDNAGRRTELITLWNSRLLPSRISPENRFKRVIAQTTVNRFREHVNPERLRQLSNHDRFLEQVRNLNSGQESEVSFAQHYIRQMVAEVKEFVEDMSPALPELQTKEVPYY